MDIMAVKHERKTAMNEKGTQDQEVVMRFMETNGVVTKIEGEDRAVRIKVRDQENH